MKRIIPLLFVLALAGCATPGIVVTGGCPIPENLDYTATGPKDLPEVETNIQTHYDDDAAERSAHRGVANDFNKLRGYVKENCK